jgi:hypothetical protein
MTYGRTDRTNARAYDLTSDVGDAGGTLRGLATTDLHQIPSRVLLSTIKVPLEPP